MPDTPFFPVALPGGARAFSDVPEAARLRGACIPTEWTYILFDGAELCKKLLDMKLETCYRLYRNYVFEKRGLFDGMLKLKGRKSRRSVYYYKRLVFGALASLHLYSEKPEDDRREILDAVSREYRRTLGLGMSPKYARAVRRLLELNVLYGKLEDGAIDGSLMITLWVMDGRSSLAQRSDNYLRTLLPVKVRKNSVRTGLLFDDAEQGSLFPEGPLPAYEKEYYLNLADGDE